MYIKMQTSHLKIAKPVQSMNICKIYYTLIVCYGIKIKPFFIETFLYCYYKMNQDNINI